MPVPMRSGEELDLSKLEPFLRSRFPGETEGMTLQQFPSGHSNLTYAVTLGEREMVLRRPPFGTKVKSAHDMRREFRVLSKLHNAYPLAPAVLLYCDDESIIGAPFYLMERLRGVIIRQPCGQGLEGRLAQEEGGDLRRQTEQAGLRRPGHRQPSELVYGHGLQAALSGREKGSPRKRIQQRGAYYGGLGRLKHVPTVTVVRQPTGRNQRTACTGSVRPTLCSPRGAQEKV
jgi:hypothetical protein